MKSFHRTVLTLFVISLLLLSLGGFMNSSRAESSEENEFDTPYFPKPDGSPWPPDGGKSDAYYNATTWDTEITFDDTDVPVENDIDLKAHIETVKTGGGTYNAHIYVTAISTSQWDLDTGHSTSETADLEKISISAEQCSNSHDNDFTIDWKETNNAGENLTDEKDDGEVDDKQEEITTDLVLGGLDELNPVPMGLLDTLGKTRKYYFSEYYDADSSIAKGEGTAELTFEAKNMGSVYNPEGSPFYHTDDKSVHIASSMIDWELPHGQIDSEHTLTISAKNILLHTEIEDNKGEIETEEVGAEATVEIPIKNAEIEDIESDNKDSYGDSKSVTNRDGSLDWDDEIGVKLNAPDKIDQEGESLMATDPPEDYDPNVEVPKVNLTVDWGDGTEEDVKEDWNPYYWEMISKDPNEYERVDKEVSISHTYDLEDDLDMDYGNEEKVDIKITAEVHDEYGGWEESIEFDLTIKYRDSDDDGGGGCPYVSPYNGTKFKRDNNILVQSEFKDGEVTDYYKLDNDLAEQNGNYSLKIEEFENSEDYIDQMKLYTLDHKEGYKVGVTPEGEYLTYKDSEAPIQAYTSEGEDILGEVEEKNDGQRLGMEAGSEIILDYGDMPYRDWIHNKLVLRSSGFSSYTDGDEDYNSSALMPGPIKTSLYVELRAGNSDWYNVTTTHPRNDPHDHVIPLEDTIHEMLKDGHRLDDMEVKIRSTKQHNVDYVGLDDSVPTPVKVQEADLLEVMKNNLNGTAIEKTGSLEHDDSNVVNLVPGEECTVTFEAPDRVLGDAFEERDIIIETTGWYEKYE
ncbi:MAG: hypothetical protein ACLFSM_09185 [Thermoplasmata archaeon]